MFYNHIHDIIKPLPVANLTLSSSWCTQRIQKEVIREHCIHHPVCPVMLCLLNTSKITYLQDNIYYTYDHKQIIVLVQFSLQNMLKNKMLICCECICLSANCSRSIGRWITKLGAQVHLRPLKVLSVSHMMTSSCYLANPYQQMAFF